MYKLSFVHILASDATSIGMLQHPITSHRSVIICETRLMSAWCETLGRCLEESYTFQTSMVYVLKTYLRRMDETPQQCTVYFVSS